MLRRLRLPAFALLGLAALSGAASACETSATIDSEGNAQEVSVDTSGSCQSVHGVLRGGRSRIDVVAEGHDGELTVLSAGGGHDLEIISVGDRRRGMVFSGLCGRGRGSNRVVLSGDDVFDVVVVPCH